MQATNLLLTLGRALATSQLTRSASAIDFEDVLGVVGLARRRSYLVQNLALLGVGAAVGAGVALLLAPASGSETRKRLSERVEALTDQAGQALSGLVPTGRALEDTLPDAPRSRATNGPAANYAEKI